MSWADAMCFAFDVSPSDLPTLYEEKAWCDLQHKVQLRLQFEQSKVLQEFQNLGLILSAAFGGGESGGQRDADGNLIRPDADGGEYKPKNADELKSMMRGMLSGKQG